MSEAVQLEWIKQMPYIIAALAAGIPGTVAAWKSWKTHTQSVENAERIEKQNKEIKQDAVEAKQAVVEAKDAVQEAKIELKESLDVNTKITVKGVNEAKKAYTEANDLNRKIFQLHEDHKTIRQDLATAIQTLQDTTGSNAGRITRIEEELVKHFGRDTDDAIPTDPKQR